MKLTIKINMDNAAFWGPDDNDEEKPGFGAGSEVARILCQLASSVDMEPMEPRDGGTLRDVNGNKVGTWEVRKGEAKL